MSPPDHADFDALSAYVDGEAPEWADHVAGCETCQATVAELRAVSVAVGAPVGGLVPAVREAAIAAALGVMLPAGGAGAGDSRPPGGPAGGSSRLAPERHEAERARFARRTPRPWAMPAVAAVVLAVLGLSGVFLSSYRTSDNFTVAGPALESGAKAGAPQAPVSDLGDIPDAATLRNRALNGAATSTGRSSSSANPGAVSDSSAQIVTGAPNASSGAGGSAPNSGPTAGQGAISGSQPSATNSGSAGAPAPAVVGTRPCEEQARTRDPSLGPVVSFATARRAGVDGYVLGFVPAGTSTAGATSPVTLLLLAQDGCRELLRSAGP